MVLSAKLLARELRDGQSTGGLTVVPCPDLTALEASGEASINLRLGRWFLTLRQSSETHLDPIPTAHQETKYAKKYYVPFGDHFVLHPNRFVLASTLEWVRLPVTRSALVVGKSTLGRRGIIIETAAGVHPGFSGCLTLEIANLGEIPVRLVAGMLICQLFVHSVEGATVATNTGLSGQRKPRLGNIKYDEILDRLIKSRR